MGLFVAKIDWLIGNTYSTKTILFIWRNWKIELWTKYRLFFIEYYGFPNLTPIGDNNVTPTVPWDKWASSGKSSTFSAKIEMGLQSARSSPNLDMDTYKIAGV
jgi:hypothetical protein